MLGWQKAALAPAPFAGTVECAGGGCRLEMQLPTPTVRFIVVRHDAAPAAEPAVVVAPVDWSAAPVAVSSTAATVEVDRMPVVPRDAAEGHFGTTL